MECPKCGHTQDDTVKCKSCGVYFAKLHKPTVSSPPRSSHPVAGAPRIGFGALLGTALITAVVVSHFMRRSDPHDAARSPAHPDALAAAPPTTTAMPSMEVSRAIASQVLPAAGHNSIETARKATVLIKTGWGYGSGFIIDADCHVITNRHVVETDGARVANTVASSAEMRARIAVAEQQLRANIVQQLQLRRSLVGEPGTNLQVIEIDERVQAMKEELADLPERVNRDISQRVEGSGRSGFTAMVVDGTEFNSLHAAYADNRDLAIFQLPANHCPHLEPGNSGALAQGERLYTIGNPSGLAYSVTSGIFSGDRGAGQERFLQTDAPINPGNSGGPLIRENGEVVGINTLVLQGAQGIGFAIPIEAVYQEFLQLRAPQH